MCNCIIDYLCINWSKCMKKEKKIKAKNNSNKKKNDIRKIKPVDVVFELIDEPKKSKNKE